MFGLSSCLLLPFVSLWRLLTIILGLAGRFVALGVGLILLAAGVLISLTGIGVLVGVPMATLGFLLMVRGFF